MAEGALTVETPLVSVKLRPDSHQPLAARTVIQFDGDVVTLFRREAAERVCKAHRAQLDACLAGLQDEAKAIRRRLGWLPVVQLAGRVCLIAGGAASIGSAAAHLPAIADELPPDLVQAAAVALWPQLAVTAIGVVLEIGWRRLLRRLREAVGAGFDDAFGPGTAGAPPTPPPS